MWYYQTGGSDDAIDIDDQDQSSSDSSDNTGYDDMSDKFDALQSHYEELKGMYDELHSKLSDEDNFNSLMGTYDNDNLLSDDDNTFAANNSDGEPVNWINVNKNLDTYKEHYNNVTTAVSTLGDVRQQIANKESQGKYTAMSPHSSATGKYQFLWSQWGDSIKKVTGVKDQQAFRNSPEAQEKYYSWYEKNYLMPQVNKIKSQVKTNLTDQQLAKLVHFRGAGGAIKYLRGQLPAKPEAYNVSIPEYIGTAQKQLGGAVAMSNRTQNYGLNNPYYDQMYFPGHGFQEFRGLDDGTPVHIQDQRGKYRVLHGPHDKDTFFGNVKELRGYKK